MDAIKAKLKTDTVPSPEEVYKLIKAEIRAINKTCRSIKELLI